MINKGAPGFEPGTCWSAVSRSTTELYTRADAGPDSAIRKSCSSARARIWLFHKMQNAMIFHRFLQNLQSRECGARMVLRGPEFGFSQNAKFKHFSSIFAKRVKNRSCFFDFSNHVKVQIPICIVQKSIFWGDDPLKWIRNTAIHSMVKQIYNSVLCHYLLYTRILDDVQYYQL